MNTSFSELDKISKYEIIKMAFNHKLKYKPVIGLSKKIKFGIEIEALGTNFIRNLRKKRNVYFYASNPAYKPKDIYENSKWILYFEQTLFDEKGNSIRPPFDQLDCMYHSGQISYKEYKDLRESLYDGGEITSPILTDEKRSWKSLKNILEYMKKNINDLRINESCSCHTHFDIGIFNNNPELLYNFMILLSENEEVLTRFYAGEFVNLRETVEEWARPIKDLIKSSLYKKLDMTSYKLLLQSISSGIPRMKEYDFDFWEIYNDYFKYLSSSFENRLPNGTLSETIIQNNIMLIGYLMEYVATNNYDTEKGIYNLKNDIAPDEFYLADMLPNDEAKLDFLTQFYKDGNESDSNKLVKSKRIFY